MKVPFGSFDSSEVSLLQKAFDLACAELGVGANDEKRRTLIASTMISLAKVGEFDADRLKSNAVVRFRTLATERAA